MSDRILLAATKNMGKLREIQEILKDFKVLGMEEAGYRLDIEENGTSFSENARIKAEALSAASGLAVIADDSGLCVDALSGAPGVYSARYAGEGASGEECVKKLLAELRNVPAKSRSAKFVCAVCYAAPDGIRKTFLGECRGEITTKPTGSGGFGYDPVFLAEGTGKTMAELSEDEKNAISHRARALEGLCEFLRQEAAKWEK